MPAANQAVTVTATVTDETSATLLYRIDFAAEQSTPMTTAGGDLYTATIPGAAAGHLIRYRVQATNAIRTSRFPRIDDTVVYQGVVVASGITSAIPVFEWFIADADYNDIVNNPTADIDAESRARLQRDGLRQRPGQHPRRGLADAPKPSWKFEMPHGHDLDMPGVLVEPVDEFAMQADWSDHSHGRPLLVVGLLRTRRGGQRPDVPDPDPAQRRVPGPLHLRGPLRRHLARPRGLLRRPVLQGAHGAFDATRPLVEYRFEKKNPDDGDFAPIPAFLNGVDLTGTAQRNYLLANADIPEMINYAAVTAIVQHIDSSDQELLPEPGPRHRAVGDHPVGPRPHVGQHAAAA